MGPLTKGSIFLSLLPAMVFCAGVASAQSPAPQIDVARAAYSNGAFVSAGAMGEAIGGVDGLTLAAASAMAEARFLLKDKSASAALERCEQFARRAIALDQHAATPRLILAVALGLEARAMDPMTAYFSGAATEGRREIDAVLAIEPRSPRALALLGVWNLEVVKRAGPKLAQLIYGADLTQGLDACEASTLADPGDPTVGVECALAMIALDDEGQLPRSLRLLHQALALAPRDAFDRLTQAEGRKALDQLPQSAITAP
jgi:hypothetical protein